MKKILGLLSLSLITFSSAQVIIGDGVGTATTKTSVLLEFANTNDKGIILPYVQTLPVNPTEGTIILDAVSSINARVKYFNGAWIDLSSQDGNVTTALDAQPSITEATDAKSIIGAATSTANGVLVLESATKAMVLPQVSDVQNIVNPAPGMMVYVNKEGAKRLAVYNGSKWSFWKP